MKILVTGGLGFIGSHTVVELQNQGFEVVIIDNCANSHISVREGIKAITNKAPEFYNLDLRIKGAVEEFFSKNTDIGGIIHFAAFKAVGESVDKPLSYYENNICPLIYLLQKVAHKRNFPFIFSSSCTVYGQAHKLPITEDAPVQTAVSPYGNTKQIGEEILRDVCKLHPEFNVISLRYFNPIGAHSSAKLGELPLGTPENLVPYITQTAIGNRKVLSVFGTDYPTLDGTAVRDYIHVVDLAEAHVTALNKLLHQDIATNFDFYNIGSGRGNSVLEVIKTFEEVTNQKLHYTYAPRRKGDVAIAYADVEKAKKELGWNSKRSLADALLSAWKWEQSLHHNVTSK